MDRLGYQNMTAPIIPEFILQLFQNEVNEIVRKQVSKVCEMYKLDLDEVQNRLGLIELECTETPGFRLMKKKESFAPPEERCTARMLHDLEIKQCSKRKFGDTHLCRKHGGMNLKYGTIHDPLPDELRPEVLNQKKKNKIY